MTKVFFLILLPIYLSCGTHICSLEPKVSTDQETDILTSHRDGTDGIDIIDFPFGEKNGIFYAS